MDQLIDATFMREGMTYEEPPRIDQPTAPGGIILSTLSDYFGRPATLTELKALTPVTARPIVRWVLQREATQYGLDQIADEPLRIQMLDFAYNSGPALAIRWFQRVLRVARTGVMDATTVSAIRSATATTGGFLMNQALLAARLQMISRSVHSGTIDKHFDEGLENRAFSFSELTIP